MTLKHIHNIARSTTPDTDQIAGEKLLSGGGATQLWNTFSDATGQFHVGHWASDVCKMKVAYTENELCLLLSGRAALSDEAGNRQEFGPQQPFVIEAGFTGTWESLEPVVKIYAIFEPNP